MTQRITQRCAATLVGVAVLELCLAPAHAAPESIFRSAPQMPDAEPAKGGSVTPQSGDYTFSIPIEVPPGRLQAVPGLALRYSSSAPVHGSSVGHGWTLDGFPTIRRDTRAGPLGREQPWISDLAGGARLVQADTPALADDVAATYYAEHDPSFARYERLRSSSAYEWRVRRPLAGDVVYFGERTPGDSRQPASQTRTIAPIARSEDGFGNRVDYEYRWDTMPTLTWRSGSDVSLAPNAIFFVPTAIRYGANDAAGQAHHARVELHYDGELPTHCDRFGATIGSSISYRMGTLLASGVLTLSAIETFVRDDGSARPRAADGLRKVRSYALEHDARLASCSADHAPRRVLRSVTESAWAPNGTLSTLPPTRFDYGPIVPQAWDTSLL